jgi:hypothetical protein
MLPAFQKLPKFFETASKYLKNSKLGSLFSQAFSRLGEIIKNATSEISKLLGTPVGKATAAAAVTTGVAYGAEKGMESLFGGDSSNQVASSNTNDDDDDWGGYSGEIDYGEF